MKLLTVYLVLLSAFLSAQNTVILSPLTMKSSKFVTEDYGKSNLNIYYQFVYSDQKNFPNSKPREGLCLLQIGDYISKFSDVTNLKLDSLKEKYSRQEYVDNKDINVMLRYNVLWKTISLKNNRENKVTFQHRVRQLYEYEEELPTFDWILQEGEKKIIGYNCKKASVKYRGRDYLAWYSTEIPVNNGPYVFQGLPGLILELEDSENKFHFVATGINKTSSSIYIEAGKNIIKTSRDQFRNMKEAYYYNPAAFHGSAYNSDGSKIITRSNKIPYDPMELE